MKISVVIPAFNEERLLGASLREVNAAMAAFTERGWATELIVCDNNSTDRTAEIARAAGAQVVFEPVNQIARARNAGAAAATGDWLVFVDADSHPSRELFCDVASQIVSGRCLAGGSTIRLDGAHRGGHFITGVWNLVSRWGRTLAGSFIFLEAETFRKVGGFSNELFAGEELDLTLRLKRLGKGSGKRVVILHRHPLLTSARKLHLYTAREMFGFFIRAVLARKRVLRSREECAPWYDGRR
ncbi:MAG: hypothetical protein RLY20_2079 [Verrucomicrobiota bacterium]|jgi:glycosyltransferase involved in cell wall biosynthesis